MQIYIGNLPPDFTDAELKALVEPFGKIRAATIGIDKKTGKPAGYGFVEMLVKSEARAAVDALRGKDIKKKKLLAKILKPGDDFFAHAENMHGGVSRGSTPSGGKQPRTTGIPRSGGIMRRGGQRGS